jgi:hypothetical protein
MDDFLLEDEGVVDRNPSASSDRQHEEPGGSQDCWWAPVPRSTVRYLAHILASRLLGVPPDLIPDQEGVIYEFSACTDTYKH